MSDQRYVSNELGHFVGRGKSEQEQFDLLVYILQTGWISHFPHKPEEPSYNTKMVGFDPNAEIENMYTSQTICFCDIPREDLKLHMNKYSRFGIWFTRQFLVENGANPVFYITKNSLDHEGEQVTPREDVIRKLYLLSQEVLFPLMIPNIIDGQITNFNPAAFEFDHLLSRYVFGYFKIFDASLSEDDENNFYMEREWRIFGNLKFTINDISSIYLPQEYSQIFRQTFPNYYGQVIFT